MQAFLGFCNYYRVLVNAFAELAARLYEAAQHPAIPNEPRLVGIFEALQKH